MQSKYYSIFENRKPYFPSKYSIWKDALFQIVAIVFIFVGVDYLYWRWNHSINWDAVWVSIPLFVAEILAFIGSLLTIINYWSHKDLPKQKPVHYLSEIQDLINNEDRPIIIDLYIATYNEDLVIVEDTVRDATKVKYPYKDVTINIYLLDDGRRDGSDPNKENFKALAEKYNINYITRDNNIGFKAGNMNNAFYQTHGDIIVVLDADTRIFPDFLINTTGYFRNKKMAWVQTPQWFYDIPPGVPLNEYLKTKYGIAGNILGKIIPFSKNYLVGKNVFGTDPELFYDVILRRRNASNASFSCGAGSLQRRNALEKLAVKEQAESIKKALKKNPKKTREELKKEIPLRPFVHHISEDIFTSIMLHAQPDM
jgi:cellulose synthase (UDP-forming)